MDVEMRTENCLKLVVKFGQIILFTSSFVIYRLDLHDNNVNLKQNLYRILCFTQFGSRILF